MRWSVSEPQLNSTQRSALTSSRSGDRLCTRPHSDLSSPLLIGSDEFGSSLFRLISVGDVSMSTCRHVVVVLVHGSAGCADPQTQRLRVARSDRLVGSAAARLISPRRRLSHCCRSANGDAQVHQWRCAATAAAHDRNATQLSPRMAGRGCDAVSFAPALLGRRASRPSQRSLCISARGGRRRTDKEMAQSISQTNPHREAD